MTEILLDAVIDTLKLVPFLFVTYWFMEWLEHKTGTKTQALIRRAGRLGPLFGGLLGVFPQCGFSAAAANLYSGGLVTAGTIAAVFISTSDEMVPIFISEAVPVLTIIKILAFKFAVAVVFGFILDFIFHEIIHKEIRYKDIHSMCESEHCKCDEGILKSTIHHTLHITLFIFLITLVLNLILHGVGEDKLAMLFTNMPVVGELIAGIVGLIPNCAASVVITELYIKGVIGAGPMITGLMAGAGIGMLVMFRMNKKHPRHNLAILGYVYAASVLTGILLDFTGLRF